ncbi:MAG: alpha/beta hydrolase [Cyclobacteriaceae bacterium]
MLYHLIKESSLKNKPAPLLILLHGYGSNEEDLFGLANEFDKEYLVISVRAPQTLAFGGYAWFNIDFTPEGIKVYDEAEIDSSLETVKAFITECKEKHSVDENHIYLAGFSQGAILSHLIAYTYPEMVQGILAMSGFAREGSIKNRADLEQIRKLDVCITHGTEDPVIPVQQARATKELLDKWEIPYQYKEYPMAHGISPECLVDISQWISDRIKIRDTI